MLNIAFVSNLFPSKIEPTRGMFNKQLVQSISKQCKVTVVCPLPYFPSINLFKKYEKWFFYSQIPNKYVWEGTLVYSPKYFMIPKISEAFHSFLVFYSIFRVLRFLKLKNRVDIVNAHYLYPDGVASYWACRFLKIPIVLSALGSDVNVYAHKPLISKQIIKSLNECSKATTVSGDLAKKLINLGASSNKIDVILNGVDFSLFQLRNKIEVRSSLSIPKYKKLIVYVGRLSEEKGVKVLIDAARLLKKEGTIDLKVVIIGDGPLRSNLENEAIHKNCSFISFLGFLNLGDISKWLNAADLLCLPSLSEGCPNVILEALCSGLPVVASNVGGIPELITESENGMLFKPGDSNQLSVVLKKALSRKWSPHELRQSISNRSWKRVAIDYYKVYCEVIARR